MAILVLGGAGYIGSVTVDQLIKADYDVIVIDSLVTGHREALNAHARFYEGDVRDKIFMTSVFDHEQIDAVIHFAAFSIVPESMKSPLKYFDNNIGGMITVLEVMQEHDVKSIVFSSTAATYGEPEQMPIRETDPQVPTNPYGESKLAMEKMMRWADEAYGIHFAAMRYFNVAGSSMDGTLGEVHDPETHLIPKILEVAAGERDVMKIFGVDYDTKDGTNVRDYIHVVDLADAHILAAEYLKAGNQSQAFNLGSAQGFSNLEVLEAARKMTGKKIPYEPAPRRAGDPTTLIASSDRARDVLKWEPKHESLDEMIATAWQFKSLHPKGY